MGGPQTLLDGRPGNGSTAVLTDHCGEKAGSNGNGSIGDIGHESLTDWAGDLATEIAEQVTAAMLISGFDKIVWPKYSNAAVKICYQTNLKDLEGTIYWDNPARRYVIVCRPQEDRIDMLLTLLHETGHAVLGHVPKLKVPPVWAGADGIDEATWDTLQTAHQPPGSRTARTISKRERDTCAWADRELDRWLDA